MKAVGTRHLSARRSTPPGCPVSAADWSVRNYYPVAMQWLSALRSSNQMIFCCAGRQVYRKSTAVCTSHVSRSQCYSAPAVFVATQTIHGPSRHLVPAVGQQPVHQALLLQLSSWQRHTSALFASTSISCLPQVAGRLHIVAGTARTMYHERQHLMQCAMHALNNLFQEPWANRELMERLALEL